MIASQGLQIGLTASLARVWQGSPRWSDRLIGKGMAGVASLARVWQGLPRWLGQAFFTMELYSVLSTVHASPRVMHGRAIGCQPAIFKE